MAELLDAVRGEIDERERRLAEIFAQRDSLSAELEQLREIEKLVFQLDGAASNGGAPKAERPAPRKAPPRKAQAAAPPNAEAAPARTVAQAAKGANLEDRVRRAKNFLHHRENGATPAEIRAHLGMQPHGGTAARSFLKALADDPAVEVTGATNSRRYRLRQQDPKGRQEPTLEGRLMSVLQIPRAVHELPTLVEAPIDDIMREIKRLKDAGEIEAAGADRWRACL